LLKITKNFLQENYKSEAEEQMQVGIKLCLNLQFSVEKVEPEEILKILKKVLK
jgi:hypothetical protein